MSNLQQFNETLNNFNREVEQLKYVSGAYKKLQQVSETYNEIIEQFKANSHELKNLGEEQVAQQQKVAAALAELENLSQASKAELAKLLEDKTDKIRQENKEFYRDLESTIKIKLDENRSQIQHLIESERHQIKQLIELEISKSTKELSKSINGVKTISLIVGSISLIALLIILLKSFAIL